MWILSFFHFFLISSSYTISKCAAEPLSKPYIAYRTDPFEQPSCQRLPLDSPLPSVQPRPYQYDEVPSYKCPLQMILGLAQQQQVPIGGGGGVDRNAAILAPPVLFPMRSGGGTMGSHVVYTTAYEHLHVLQPGVMERPSSASSSSSAATSNNKHHPATSTTSSSSSSSSTASSRSFKELLVEPPTFPLLLESSAYMTSPVLHDANADGLLDAMVMDYDGGLSLLGIIAAAPGAAAAALYRHHGQVPRMFVRREWIEHGFIQPDDASLTQQHEDTTPGNATASANNDNHLHDPFHSYFEYYYENSQGRDLIRGESANIFGQSSADVAALTDRRRRAAQSQQRKLLETTTTSTTTTTAHGRRKRRLEELMAAREQFMEQPQDDVGGGGGGGVDAYDDVGIPEYDEGNTGDDMLYPEDDAATRVEAANARRYMGVTQDAEDTEEFSSVPPMPVDDPAIDDIAVDDDPAADQPYDDYNHFRYQDDEYEHYHGDDMYSNEHNDYYDTKHYVRITPHVLATPVHAELPKQYGNTNEKEDLLFVAVSYYLDEDEFEELFHYKRFESTDEGQENEVRRGGYVANAIMAYVLGEYGGRWTGQTHLDLSTDYSAPENVTVVGSLPIRSDTTQMSALCLASPTVADLNGDGNPDVVLGTNMGMVYVLDARQMTKREHWPVQLPRPVEHRVVVEDVMGDTNLELFVADIGGDVVCLNHAAEVLWHRNWIKSLQLEATVQTVEASSPIVLGDINGDGHLDLVQVIWMQGRVLVFAVQASTGTDLRRFPMELDGAPEFHLPAQDVHQKLAQPLLVDLHSDQSYVTDYLRRNGTSWEPVGRSTPSAGGRPHGGSGAGLHVVVPAGDEVFIIEGATGCTQKISIGEPISAMVQTDDVHGTGQLDLVVATNAGNIITLESKAPFHPLNTWTGGDVRRRGSNHAHGLSASQGIFVHEASRQLVDVFGVYVPVTFEIFDNRPGIAKEPHRRKYLVDIRDGPSWKRSLFREEYSEPGVYTARVYVRYGPGYYTLSVTLQTSHGIMYEDSFSVGYNLGYLDGFGVMLWLPLLVASTVIVLYGGQQRGSWDDEEDELNNPREGALPGGILGATLPT